MTGKETFMEYRKRGTEKTIKDVFMRNIGVKSLDEVTGWFKKSYADDYHIKDMDKAVSTVLKFKNSPVTIVGDYDGDGITSTSILYMALARAGFKNVRYRIPKRFSEGFHSPTLYHQFSSVYQPASMTKYSHPRAAAASMMGSSFSVVGSPNRQFM